MKYKMNFWLLVSLILLAIILWITDTPVRSQDSKYMIIRNGGHGLNFQCVDNLPYTISHAMIWDENRGAIEIDGFGRLVMQIIQVENCNLDNVYRVDNRYYAWLFTSHITDEHENHRHLTRGAWWIDLN